MEEGHKIKGNEFFIQKNFSEALGCYERAIAINQNYKEAWFNKAMCHKLLGQMELAKEAFGRALQLDSTYEKARYQLRLLELPAQIIFAIADLKLTPDGKVKIFEFGRGMQSGFIGHDHLYPEEPIIEKLKKALKKFKPAFCNSLPGLYIANDEKLPDFLKQVGSSSEITIPSRKISDYKAIYLGSKTRPVNKDILVMDNSPIWHLVGQNKYMMHLLFADDEKALAYRPRCEIFPLRYETHLAEKIKKTIPGKRYVLKVPDLSRGEGVIIADANELEDILTFLLFDKPEDLTEISKKFTRKLITLGYSPERIFHKIEKLSDLAHLWRTTNADVFLVEEYCQSKPFKLESKTYDPTMRVAFLITINEGIGEFIPLGCYWKLPDKAIGEGELREHSISHITPDKTSSQKVAKEDEEKVYQQLRNIIPSIFIKMFIFNETKLLEKPSLVLQFINALGAVNRFDQALSIMKNIEEKDYKYYHEKGVLYANANNLEKAVIKFSKAIEKNSYNSSTFFRRARAYGELKQKEKALSDFSKAKELGFNEERIKMEKQRLGI